MYKAVHNSSTKGKTAVQISLFSFFNHSQIGGRRKGTTTTAYSISMANSNKNIHEKKQE